MKHTNSTRRRIIQIAGFIGGSFLAAIFTREIWKTPSSRKKPGFSDKPKLSPSSTPTPSPTKLMLKPFAFETVTVDASGSITNRRNQEAQYFTQDLGNGVTLDMVQIPEGTFTMGSPAEEEERKDDEEPQHQVTVPGFFMGKYEVTQAQYQVIMGKNPSYFQDKKRPVDNVSWHDATEFCNQLSQKTGRTYRLPSEAEWEYACRAGTTTPFYFGETITTELANYNGKYPYASAPEGKYRKETTDVGIFPPNAFGLYDMHGNLWEWCQDTSHKNYQGAPIDGSAWIGNDNRNRIMRGGSWSSPPEVCRSAIRSHVASGTTFGHVGFRVCMVLG